MAYRTRPQEKLEFKISKALDFQLVKMLVDAGLIGTMTDAEMNLITDPFFEKIFYELDKRKDLNKEDKKNLADILMRIIKSYSMEALANVFKKRDCRALLAKTNGVFAVIARSAATWQSRKVRLLQEAL